MASQNAEQAQNMVQTAEGFLIEIHNMLGRMRELAVQAAHESLLQAANFIQAVEERQGIIISNPEEIAYRMGFIDRNDLRYLAKKLDKNQYGQYLLRLLEE